MAMPYSGAAIPFTVTEVPLSSLGSGTALARTIPVTLVVRPVPKMVTMDPAVAPATKLAALVMLASVNTGPRPTVSAALAVRLSEPLTPRIVKLKAPSGVFAVVLTTSVEVPGVVEEGEKLQVAPAGRSLQDKLTTALKEPRAAIVTV